VTEILLAASLEMAEAAAWYDERVSGLGERFLSEAEGAFARIDETPLTGPPWSHRRLPDGVRRMFLRSFPWPATSSNLWRRLPQRPSCRTTSTTSEWTLYWPTR
jgi:hypothetical protein